MKIINLGVHRTLCPLLKDVPVAYVTNYRSMMIPGFVDCHTDVVSYLLAGLRSKFDSIQQAGSVGNGINERRLRTMNVVANDKSAAHLFTTYVVGPHCKTQTRILR